MPIETTADPVDPEEAIRYFRAKLHLTDEQWQALTDQNNDLSFRLAGVADIDVVEQVWSELDKAVAAGTDFRDFKAAVTESLTNAWGGSVSNPGWRISTIFKTNVLSSYAAGHWQQAQEQKDDRPYAQFDFVPDNDICEDCESMASEIGTVAIPLDEWSAEIPPIHFNCRCGMITLSAEEAEAMGILETMPDMSDHIDEGFGDAPGDGGLPDAEEYGEFEEDVARFTGA